MTGMVGDFAQAGAGKLSQLTRRGVVGAIAAVPIASAACLGGGRAFAATTDADVRSFQGRYAIAGGAIIDGYFVSPRGRTGLDVVLLMPGARGLDEETRAKARRLALGGLMVVAPDPATHAPFGREAMITEMAGQAANLAELPNGSGRVRIVTA